MNPTTRFTGRAHDYAAARPAYGADALAFILEGLHAPVRALDLGAGTGISSRLLAGYGVQVDALEPNASMREVAEPHRNVRFIEGMAEETGAPAAAYDLVTAFQAFHWFATDAVLQEIVRVVRPGGRAALVLNERDESDPFTAAFGAIVRRYATDDTEALRAKSLEVFRHLPGTLAEHEFPNSQQLDRSGLLRRVGSTSYLPHTGDAAEALRADVDALFAANISDGFVRMVLRTIVVRIDLPR